MIYSAKPYLNKYKLCALCRKAIMDEYIDTYYFEQDEKKYLMHNACANKVLYEAIKTGALRKADADGK